jgi:hypothetical protein
MAFARPVTIAKTSAGLGSGIFTVSKTAKNSSSFCRRTRPSREVVARTNTSPDAEYGAIAPVIFLSTDEASPPIRVSFSAFSKTIMSF